MAHYRYMREDGGPWGTLDREVQRALQGAWRANVPPIASALHARWWQLETWLRSLAYVELRAKYGQEWSARLPSEGEKRSVRDRKALRYMSTPDATDYLAYVDIGKLFPLIADNWELFQPSLIDKESWDGRVSELQKIRRRIAHCRRPHEDDLARMEQVLRDLERGAFQALSSFNDRFPPDRAVGDPLVVAWQQGKHQATHLIEHADMQYDTNFRLQLSRRPWAARSADGERISGRQGYLWHARWQTGYPVRLREWWTDSRLDIDKWRDLIVYVCADPWAIDISFPAVDDPEPIADAIGNCFQAILHHQDRRQLASLEEWDDAYEQWCARHAALDPRVQIRTSWTIVDRSTQPITIFDA